MIYPSERAGSVTHEELRDLLSYFPASGVFTWKVARGNIAVGAVAGSTGGVRRYRAIMINKRAYAAHRLAWLYMTGAWPSMDVDHIDGDSFNNAWANLRLATPRQNARNRKTPSSNKSGVKGVYWVKARKRWRAQIRDENGKIKALGLHRTVEAAEAALLEVRKTMHQEFARYA
jgi:hypothetical protein